MSAVKKRTLIGCSLIGFGSSASFLAMAALLSSPLVAFVGVVLAVCSAIDIWVLANK